MTRGAGGTSRPIQVRQDERGTWYSRVYLGRSADGRKIQSRRSFPDARTEDEARVMAGEWAAGLTADGRVTSMVLSDLLDDYVEMRAANGASPNSVRTYALYCRYVTRFLRARRADELTALDFTRMGGRLLREGGEHGGPLSPTTVNGVYQFLRGAYGYLSSVGLVSSNPLVSAAHPTPSQREATSLGARDVTSLEGYLVPVVSLEADVPPRERVEAFAIWFALHTGMRCGEVCAMRPRDVMPDRGFSHVGGTVVEPVGAAPYRKEKPKSGRSRRNVSSVPEEMAVVSRFVAWERSDLGRTDDSLPIVSVDGAWMRPTTLSGSFAALRDRLGIDRSATFHTLRHTHASWCIAHGVDVVTLSERLGHASPATTSRIYGHMLAGRDMSAASAFWSATSALAGGCRAVAAPCGADGDGHGGPAAHGTDTDSPTTARPDKN